MLRRISEVRFRLQTDRGLGHALAIDALLGSLLKPKFPILSAAGPFGLVAKMEEHFAGFGHDEDPFILSVFKIFETN